MDQGTTLEAYSYRVSARFGSRVWVTFKEDTLFVTGPRVSLPLYRLWIAAQALLLALVVLALVAAVALWNGRYLIAALGLLLVHLALSGFGAGCLWEMMNLSAFAQGTRGETVSFPLNRIRDVRIGEGWARRGMWLLVLPYFKAIDSLARGLAVSFVAPDGTPDGGVYALHMATPEEAQALAARLRAEEAPLQQPDA